MLVLDLEYEEEVSVHRADTGERIGTLVIQKKNAGDSRAKLMIDMPRNILFEREFAHKRHSRKESP